MSSWVWDPKLSLYGTVPAEGGEAPEGGPGQPVHLGDVQVLQRGAGGGEGKEAGLTNVVAASDGELAKTKEGPTKGGQAWVRDWALAQVQRAQSAAAGRQAGQAGKNILIASYLGKFTIPDVCYQVATTQVEVAQLVAEGGNLHCNNLGTT